MTLPAVFLGILIGAIPGGAFHFWRGGGFKWMVLYILLSIAGFWIGHLAGFLLRWHFLALGPINLGSALIGSLIFVFGGYWLSMASVEVKSKK